LEGKKFLKEWRKKHSNEKKLYVSSHVAVKKKRFEAKNFLKEWRKKIVT
jgi:hypothetical protein